MDYREIFENYILNTNVLNFIVLVLILAFCIVKFDLKGMLNAMQKKVADLIEEVKQNKLNSEKTLADAKSSVKNLASDIKTINTDADESAKAISEKIMKEAEVQVKNIENNADKVISAEEKQVVADLIKEVSAISIDKSKENIQNMLANNIELHEKYINESIDKLDGLAL